MGSTNLDYAQHVSGDTQIEHAVVTIASGENVAQYTPLKFDAASGHFKAMTDAESNAQYLSAFAVDATSGAVEHSAIKAIAITPEAVNWPDGYAETKKQGVFAGSPINVQEQQSV
jgi:hypothetical protein